MIVGGETAIAVLIEHVFGIRTGSAGDEHVRHIVQEFRVGIPRAEQESVRKGTFQLELARVIDGVATVGAGSYGSKIRIVEERIHVRVNEQVFSASPDIGGSQEKSARELPFDVQIPLMRERV